MPFIPLRHPGLEGGLTGGQALAVDLLHPVPVLDGEGSDACLCHDQRVSRGRPEEDQSCIHSLSIVPFPV